MCNWQCFFLEIHITLMLTQYITKDTTILLPSFISQHNKIYDQGKGTMVFAYPYSEVKMNR